MQLIEADLEYDGRKNCRSIVDVLQQFRNIDPSQPVQATIRTRKLFSPNRIKSNLVLVVRLSHTASRPSYVRMPNSHVFQAKFDDGTSISDKIAKLNDARVSDDGLVLLQDGREFRQVTFQPSEPTYYEFSEQQDTIVRKAIEILEEESNCYRSLAPDLLPHLMVLDYGRVADVRIRRLGALKHKLHKAMPRVSDLEINKALRLSGMRHPRD